MRISSQHGSVLPARHPRHARVVVFLALVATLLVAFAGLATAQVAPTMPPMGHDHGMAMGTPTAAQQAAADKLVAETRADTARFADVAVAEAAGYRQVTPFAFFGARAAHFQNPAYVRDGKLLDPERPEDLIYLKKNDGSLVLVGVMYTAPIGKGPDIGGPLTHWHTHDDLCGSQAGLVPTLPDGTCPQGTAHLTFEMLHVWLIPSPEGPFAEGPPPSIVTTPLATVSGGSLAAGVSLIDAKAMGKALSETLGLNQVVLAARLAAGKSLAEIAAAQGVSREKLVGVIEGRLVTDYATAVQTGDMTASQRDLLAQVTPMMVERLIDLHAGEPWIVGDKATPMPM